MIVEVCANSLQSALNAQLAGADRIELCSELGVGGITPSYGLLKKVKEVIRLPVHVLIRPRSGDFMYSDSEFQIMKVNILQCREMGFEGIVSGVLNSDFTIDMPRTSELRQLAGDMTFTFHRAFDWIKDPIVGLVQLEKLGIQYVLSSGQKPSAPEGISLLKQLHEKSTDCKIMPGAGINELSVHEFIEAGFEAIHLSGTKFHRTLPFLPEVPMNSAAFLREDYLAVTDPDRIREIVKRVK
ncbi:copper homeostasis protein CutC [Muriicola sp. Z0-33]|uniref:copper homeostasis protein CutC n=1 Tax=Muriicola sp. Z0-33 TaxID=2816957 RepID=UPI0022388B03|nr:copper homeostasis protein CutC [Muriicola sp. Z0-33]MCW5516273.1 copper homeostasis protein CutC [Muriicola sp. Z0-33]